MEDKEGATPIIVACQSSSLPNVQLLLDSGAAVGARDAHGRTALHHCVENKDTGCAELLLKSDPCLLSTADHEGLTPLHMAVIAGNVPLIRLLLKKGASLQCRDQEEHTVAHWATVCGHSRVLDVLLEYGAELSVPDRHQAFPLHYAAQMTRQPGVTAGDDGGTGEGEKGEGVDGGEEEQTAEAANHGSNDSGGGNGPSPYTSSSSPRDQNASASAPAASSKSGQARLLRKLLDCSGVSPEVRDKDGRTPVIWAASAGNAEACRILVEAGADVNSADNDGLSALHCAASRGHSDCVRTLVSMCGARVDPLDRNECTPLFYATTLGHDACAETLLELGASPNHTDNRGRTTAHCAAVTGSRDSLEVLRKQGVDLWQPTDKGDYPIHEAAQAGHLGAIDYLLEIRGAEDKQEAVNTANRDGRTCLHIASLTNNLWLAKFLLDHHADVNAVMRNKEGRKYSPYDAAVAKGNKEAADYLQSRGGQTAKRPSSSKSKDRPASSKSRDRPPSSKSRDRPASGKSEDRPADGEVDNRPASGKVKDRPSSGKVKDFQEEEEDRKENGQNKAGDGATTARAESQQGVKDDTTESGRVTSEAGDGEDNEVSGPVLAVVVTHSDRPKSGKSRSPDQSKPGSPKKDSGDSSTESAGGKSTRTREGSAKTAKKSKSQKDKSGSKDEDAQSGSGEDDGPMVVVVPKDSSPNDRPLSSTKTTPADSPSRSSIRQQSPKQGKKDEPQRKTVRVVDTKERSSAGAKHQNKKVIVSKSASVNRSKTASKTSTSASQQTRPSRQGPQKPQQKPARRDERSQSSSSSSSRSRSRSGNRSGSRSSSRDSQSSGMSARGKKNKKQHKKNDGDGLNLFSDNDNTDLEDEAPAQNNGPRKAAAGDKAPSSSTAEGGGPDEHEHEDDVQNSGKDKKQRPRSSRLIATVQDSVRRYEQGRRSIRQLQQMRRAEIYANHCRNVALFHSLLRVYGTPSGVPTWDHILQHQPKQTPRDVDQSRSKGGTKSSVRGDSKDSPASSSKDDGPDQNHVNGNKDTETEKTAAVDRRNGSNSTANGHGDREEPRAHSPPPPRSPSPRRHRHYDYGDPHYYRQIQRQRTDNMHRLLLKAYRPSLPTDLFQNGKPQDRPPTTSSHSRPSRPSTSKSLPPRPPPCQGRPTSSMTSASGSGQQGSGTNTNSMSQAQFKAAQKSYTIMTQHGTRTIRPRSAHHSKLSQSQPRGSAASSKPRPSSVCSQGTAPARYSGEPQYVNGTAPSSAQHNDKHGDNKQQRRAGTAPHSASSGHR